MKLRPTCLLALVALAGSIQAVHAQVPPTVEIATYAGLSFTGTTGSWYNIEATTDLSQAGGWDVVATLTVNPGPYLWFDATAPVAGKRFYRFVEVPVQPVPNMVAISPGTFVMGSPVEEVGRSSNEGPQTQVTLTKGFYMGKYEVTQAEYLAVTGTNPSNFQSPVDTSRPVEMVSWNDAVAYCNTLTITERIAGRCPATWSYRLPTEAEWEYACRAGTTTRFSYGEDPVYALLTNYAWYDENSGSMTHSVGQKLANGWGLFDMHGNVHEWVQDSSDGSGSYPGGSTTDPLVTTGDFRRFRGGDWRGGVVLARCARRVYHNSTLTVDLLGFRLVLAPGQ